MRISSLILVIVFVFGRLCPAAALSATDILKQGERQLRGRSTQTIMTMKIKRSDFTRSLQLRSWAIGGNRALVEILEPAKETGVTSLRSGNQMWNYLPKTDQVVRVPTSLMLQSWMGSDFTNDDLMQASSLVRDYHHRILKREKIGAEDSVLIECLPKKGARVVWGKVLYWARVSDNLPVQQKFFDDGQKWVRTFSFSRFRKMDDRVIPSLVKVTKADAPKEFTLVSYQKFLFDREIPASLFSKESIRRTSQRGRDLASLWSEKRDRQSIVPVKNARVALRTRAGGRRK